MMLGNSSWMKQIGMLQIMFLTHHVLGHDATVPEIKAFVGMLILMGILDICRDAYIDGNIGYL